MDSWTALAVDETVIDAMRSLQVGEPIVVTGELGVKSIPHSDEGGPLISLSVKADGVLSLRVWRRP